MTIIKPTREEWIKWMMDTPVIPENIPEYHTGDAIKLFDPKTDKTEFVPPTTQESEMTDPDFLQELLDLPFHEYMARRTKFAVDRAHRDNLITIDYAGLSLLQAMWAREYWLHKNEGAK